jgi:hypothetical protein
MEKYAIRVRPKNGPMVNCEGVVLKMCSEFCGKFEERGFEQRMVHGVNGIAQSLPKLGQRMTSVTTSMSQQKPSARYLNTPSFHKQRIRQARVIDRKAPTFVPA